jgi:hypothetical protein
VLAHRVAEQVRLHGPGAADDPEVLLIPTS